VDQAKGLAFGILYHLTQIVPLVVVGTYYAFRMHLHPSDLATESA
jgi:hypothetical protein